MISVSIISTKRRLQEILAAIVVFAALPAAGQDTTGAWGVQPSDYAILNTSGWHGTHPDVAASEDGRHVFVVWEGERDGRRRIFIRESFDGEWLPESVIDADPSALNMSPVVDVDSGGRPHVTWIASVNGRRVPIYAHRPSKRPGARWSIHELLPRDYPEVGDCDYVAVKCDANGSPWIAWQSGFGSAYSIFAAYAGTDGKALKTVELTALATGPNLYPEILLQGAAPTIIWYTGTDVTDDNTENRYALAGKWYDSVSGAWLNYSPQNFDQIEPDALPLIVQQDSSELSAFWYRNISDPANPELNNDRILLGEQNPDTRGAGVIIDDRPDRQNREVDAISDDGSYMAVWTAQSADGFSDIVAAYGSTRDTFSSIPITLTNNQQIYSSPKLEQLDADNFGVVWQAETTGSPDDGAIYFTKVTR